jgi:hypothetical protein
LLALAERLLDDPAGAEDAVHHAMLQESRGLRSSGVPCGRFPISRPTPDQHTSMQEYVFTVGEGVSQEVTWDVPAR